MKRLMLVDDESNVLQALRRTLTRAFRDEDVRIELFEDPNQALERADGVPFDVVISDFRMPIMDGLSFLKTFRALQPDAIRMLLTATVDFQTVLSAINEAEIQRYLVKPWDDEELIAIVRTAIHKRETLSENQRLADQKRVETGQLSAAEMERRRLEEECPGITRIERGPDGSIYLDLDEEDEDLK